MNKLLVPLVSVVAVAFSACGGGDDPVAVDRPWARATSAAQPHGAVYFELTVDHDDVLLGASVPAAVADHAEIHEVVEVEPADMSDDSDEMDMSDMSDDGDDHGANAPGMTMREVAGGLALSADETITFAPGGYHVMLLDLAAPLAVGEEFELTLSFADNDDVTITVPVEETAP